MIKPITIFCVSILFVLPVSAQITEEASNEDTAPVIQDSATVLPATTEKIETAEETSVDNTATVTQDSATVSPVSTEKIEDSVSISEVEQPASEPESEKEKSTVTNADLLKTGKLQKAKGVVFTCIGSIFIGGMITYTILFITDKETFGIHLGTTSTGYMIKKYYLNPGYFALPVGAPCLAVGIVNLIKGNNKIRKASSGDEASVPFEIAPYVSLGLKNKTFGACIIGQF